MELHRHHSPQKLKRIAQDLYREKKYAEALVAFNAAIKVSNGEDLSLYDGRAATHQRLDDLQAALSDGQRMLRLSETSVDGYLRAGKILQKMDRAETALKIYQRGLRLVPVSNEHYVLLQKLHDTLSRSLCPPKAVDLLSVLPMEVIEIIMNYLDFPQICQCLRVSPQWRKLLTSWPSFWRDLDFSTAKLNRPLSQKALFTYVGWSGLGTTRLALKGLSLQKSNVLKELAIKCKNLAILELHSGGALRQSLLDATSRARNLTQLTLASTVEVEDRTVHHIMDSCPSLIIVRFDRIRKSVGISDDSLFWKRSEHGCLESFTAGLSTAGSQLILSMILPPSQRLKTLRLANDCDSAKLMLVTKDLAEYAPQLEEYHLKNCCLSCVERTEDRVGSRVFHTNLYYHFPPTIRKINLANSDLKRFSWFNRLDLSADLPLLSEVSILQKPADDLTPTAFETLIDCTTPSKSNPIIKLEMSLSKFAPTDITKMMRHGRLKKLEYLKMTEYYDFDDDTATVLASAWKCLKQVSLPPCRITGVGIKTLVEALPNLIRLNVNHCQHISSDAIAWARAKGVKVGHQLLPD